MFFWNDKTINYQLLLLLLYTPQNYSAAVKCVLQAIIWSNLLALDNGPSSAAIVDVPPHAEKANFFGLSKTALLRHARARY